MADLAIRVEGLSKRYRIGQLQKYKALRDTLTDTLYAPLRAAASIFKRRLSEDAGQRSNSFIWALRDVSFEIKQGESVGIIGPNGAGKSTLLKILSRITEPTEGYAEIRGRAGSLLEVGTGFHPELTGRENIYLNGAILGMRKAEIDRKFDEIVAFAEVEKFLDTPVKHYSSGMYVRLAFAVAAHLEPEILLVDEVLAVGDAAFQKKCLGKMKDVAKEGRTVLFVSHNMSAVQRLCQKAILLDSGKKVIEGLSGDIITKYLAELLNQQDLHTIWRDEWNPPQYRDLFRIEKVQTIGSDGTPRHIFTMDEPICINVHYRVFKTFDLVRLSMHLKTSDGILVLSSTDADTLSSFGQSRSRGTFISRCWIPRNLLSPRQYVIHLGAYLANNQIIAGAENVASFEVLETCGPIAPKMQGVISPILKWEMEEIMDG